MIKPMCTLAWCVSSITSPALAASENGQEPSLEPTVRQLENATPKRVLFVGNSYLYYNDSLHNHVKRIAEEIGPLGPGEYQYKSATISGSRLSHHDVDGLLEPGRLGIDEPFELVILQGGSREVLTPGARAEFHAKAIELNRRIRATGAEVALYMIHAYVEPHALHDPGMFDKIQRSYMPAGNEIGALVVPVGLAFERAYRARPEVPLHETFDGTHPNMFGTYLAACVVYQSIYGQSVVGIEYDYFGEVPEETGKFLRRIADETVREFFGRDQP
ncbi:MAG: hypothetical protein OXI79_05285 [Gammaproteobacteria bacterium]|nr:hypothetical protein [Gammaproteobacteria bacterium]